MADVESNATSVPSVDATLGGVLRVVLVSAKPS
jgi:hypothetical protein